MEINAYLVVQGKVPKYGPNRETRREAGALRLTKSRPNTAANEIAIKLSLDIPDALFIKPTLEARISVPATSNREAVIGAEVADNIAEIIRQQTGFSVHIAAIPLDGEAGDADA